ncbi:hyphally regulated cell wall protein 1 isoform X2 [Astatotilapia calliptera]|uniref:hyphally regulated cell wall protein 1 isoform X2 n=1 Tax=Astatotilapia calliptera TaxID=8154 RepID=UPI000E3FF7E2|nr:hyphally regulated cell wall protein 1 isoform X2 [Astatotilapia calliptera]
MAGLCWLVMVPAFFLSPPNILAAVNQDWLTNIVAAVKNKYELGDSFSMALNIPQNQDPSSLQEVLQDDPADSVTGAISQDQVYKGTRVVAATQSQALSHVLHNIQPFINSSEGNVLVIYSENSPISNDEGITLNISDITNNWSDYAFVFSNVADVPASDTSQLTQSFKNLEITKLGLNNIYRCYAPGDDAFQCTRCSSGGDVTPTCVANPALSSQEQGTDVETPKPGLDTGLGNDIGNDIGTGIGTGIGTDIGTDIDSGIPPGSGRGKEGQMSKCKGNQRGSFKRRGGSKLRGGGRCKKRSKFGRRGPGRKGSKLGPRGPGRKGSKLGRRGPGRKGSKLRRRRRRQKGSKIRRIVPSRKERKLRGGGRRQKGSKIRRRGPGRKGSKLGRGGRRRNGSKQGRKEGKGRRGSKRNGRNKSRRGGKRRGKWGMAWLR